MANDYLATRVYSVNANALQVRKTKQPDHKYFIHSFRGPVRNDRFWELTLSWAQTKDKKPYWEKEDTHHARIGYHKYNFVGFRHGGYGREDRLGFEIRGAPTSELIPFASSLYNAVVSIGSDTPKFILSTWGSFDILKVNKNQMLNRHVE